MLVGLLAATCRAQNAPVTDTGWPTYGGDPGGQRYSVSQQIHRDNVQRLQPAWTFHTGALRKGRPGLDRASFEATPILFHGLLYIDSPYDEVFAIDPARGTQLWKFDPMIVLNSRSGVLTSRGVAAWASPDNSGGTCSSRIFVATLDTRLIALDALTGKRCAGFGASGEVNLKKGMHLQDDAPFYNSSPPTVTGNLVVVGSSIADNTRVDLASGVVRAFDVVSGKLVWAWEPIPWAKAQKLRTGAANAWSVIAADPEHNLLFVPTGAASPDFYGGLRPGDNRDANSVVALEATTGKRVWGFQVVHHDLWDYDVAAEPLLFTFRGKIPAIALATKQGLVFVLNRLTGEPLYPVTERPVPASDVPGEQASPTQPFQDLPSLSPTDLPADAMLGANADDNADCRRQMAGLRYDGIYTPPSLRGTVAFPGNLGGVNWGSAAIDPRTGILYANTNRYAYSIRFSNRPTANEIFIDRWNEPKHLALLATVFSVSLVLVVSMVRRRGSPGRGALGVVAVLLVLFAASLAILLHLENSSDGEREVAHFGREAGQQFGTPYTVLRQRLVASRSKHPCTVLPWGTVSAVNLNTGKTAWQAPLGTAIPGQHTGTINLGGDLVTASGLVFTGASEQPLLRAFDSTTGEELWQGKIPAPAQATPMSYTVDGRQYIVIAAGGHGLFGTPVSDALVAFALPR